MVVYLFVQICGIIQGVIVVYEVLLDEPSGGTCICQIYSLAFVLDDYIYI